MGVLPHIAPLLIPKKHYHLRRNGKDGTGHGSKAFIWPIKGSLRAGRRSSVRSC